MSGGSKPAPSLERGLPIAAALLLFLSLLFGGGGAEAPFRSGLLEGTAAILLTAIVARHFAGQPLPAEAVGPVWIAVLVLALILMQLIPLPPGIWQSLPGREAAAAAAGATGQEGAWKPLSLDPEATRRTSAAFLLPLSLALATISSSPSSLRLLIRTILAGALVSAILGGFQIAAGNPEWLAPYGAPNPGVATGLFANANHQAMLMLVAIVATGLYIRIEPSQIRIRRPAGSLYIHLAWLLYPIFVVLIVAAQSRAGLALMLPALAASALLATGRKGGGKWIIVGAGAALGAALLFSLTPGSAESMMHLQSSLMGEGRFINLPDVIYTMDQFWPWGSGFGTFVPVFQANENLDLIGFAWVNHAHNEPLEWLIEAGLPGALVLAIVLGGIAWRAFGLIRRVGKGGASAPALAGLVIIGLLLLQSLVDYPMRTDALASIAGVAAGLFLSPLRLTDAESKPKRARRRRGFGSPIAGWTDARSARTGL